MKLNKFLIVLFAAIAIVGCKEKNTPEETQTNPLAGDEGYVGVTVKMPTISAAGMNAPSRRTNDVFDDGTAAEYAVAADHSYLILFQNDNSEAEDDATFCGIYKLSTSFASHPSEQITVESNKAQQIVPNLISKGRLYAYIILNDNGLVTNYDATTHSSFTFGESITVKKADGTTAATIAPLDVTTTTTFGEFRYQELQTITNAAKDAFVMTNAILSNKRGGAVAPTGATLSVLAPLDLNKIYPTASLAEANPAGHVDVERAAAKITLSNTLSGTTVDGVAYDKTSVRWAVGNVNQSYYNTRKWATNANDWLSLAADATEGTTPANSKYRFVSNAPLGTTVLATDQDVYRTYWAIDPNYEIDYTDATNLRPLANPSPAPSMETTEIAYVTENTFDVEHQTYRNTTYVGVSLAFNEGADFYIIPEYGDNKMLQKPDYTGSLLTIKQYLLQTYMSTDANLKAYLDADAANIDNIVMTFTADETGKATVATLTVPAAATGVDADAVKDAINALDMYYYAGGKAYYGAKIKHFGAGGVVAGDGSESGCETPWNRNKHTDNTVAGAYGNPVNTQNFLGRYGILRNNWYDISLTGVRKIGKPVPVVPDGTPDDEVENYLSVEIHITPWAKRTQSVVL